MYDFPEYPNPCFPQVEVDLKRTFPDDPFYSEEKVQTSLKNILMAYIKRNPTIGYCQGMNFVAGRLLKVLEEEEAFWVLCQLLESILPLDYYSNMVGVLVDQKIFFELIKTKMSDLHRHLDNIKLDLNLIAF